MPQTNKGHYEVIKMFSEYTMLPLNFLALGHHYYLAIAIGGIVFVVYSLASLLLIRANRHEPIC